ncbi:MULTISPECIES: hypothetical protein [unclassified Variovorax]|uniref:hypothetical protein n=1 Tax=unclassified Variovorax TaxID=663243 RepID=UPI0011601174|nr:MULTISPECIES: hypothetical protein [unclassified Variovorax]
MPIVKIVLNLLDQKEILGRVTVELISKNKYAGEFSPFAEFESCREIFSRHEEMVESQQFVEADRVESELGEFKFFVMPVKDVAARRPVFDLQIMKGGVSFRCLSDLQEYGLSSNA